MVLGGDDHPRPRTWSPQGGYTGTMTWIAPLATFGVPAAAILLATWMFTAGRADALALVLLAAFPLGLATGYVLAGVPLRGLAVVAGGYALLALALGALFSLPTEFEDAGVLIGGGAVVLALGLVGYAGWAAWDVHAQTLVRWTDR